MKIRNQIILIISLVLTYIIISSIYEKYKKGKRNKSAKYTCGKIIWIFKTSKGITSTGFIFNYNNKNYESSFGGNNLNDCYKNKECIGKCYLVEFSSKNPENNVMLFDKPCNCDDIKDNIK